MMIKPAGRWAATATLLSALVMAPATGASARPVACGPPVASPTQPGYTIADPHCDPNGTPFEPLTDAAGSPVARVYAGIHDGAAYRIEVPLRWNGELVIHAHGYRGEGTTVFVDNPSIRPHLVERGFAWAASSYQTNGYDVGQGARDSHALLAVFRAVTGNAARVAYMTGVSMGGHVTAVTIEHFRGSYAGALPYCGVLGDAELFDFFLDANVTAAALAEVPISFPLQPGPDFAATFRAAVLAALPRLGVRVGGPPALTQRGEMWSAAVELRSGGRRPGFDGAFAFWNSIGSSAPLNDAPFLFGRYPGLSGGTIGVAAGNVTSDRFTVYQLDDRWWLSREEAWLNREVLRVRPTTAPSHELAGIPRVKGDPRIPVLSLHTIGDLFVPLSMEQVYAVRVALHGQSRRFVTRAIRANGHCEFTQLELRTAFDDLVSWVRTGRRPAGDAVLDRRAVARPDFGCRFTVGVRATFVAPPCPPA
jgi:hypothetical protein